MCLLQEISKLCIPNKACFVMEYQLQWCYALAYSILEVVHRLTACLVWVHDIYCNLSLPQHAILYIKYRLHHSKHNFFQFALWSLESIVLLYYDIFFARMIHLPIQMAGLLFHCCYCLICKNTTCSLLFSYYSQGCCFFHFTCSWFIQFFSQQSLKSDFPRLLY